MTLYFRSPRRFIIIGMVMVITLVAEMFLTACSRNEAVKQGNKIYRIGAVLPMTGPIGYLGGQELLGLKLAVEDINSRAKENGFTVEIRLEDFASQPSNAVTAARKLIDVDKIDLLFVSTTSATRAIAPIAQDNNIPMLVISSDPQITQVAPVVHRVFMNSGVEQHLLAERLLKLSTKSVYVLYNRDRAFESAYQELRDLLQKGGVRNISADSFEKTQHDFRVAIEKAKRARTDAYVIMGFGSEFPNLLSQWGSRSAGRFYGNYTFGTAGAQSQGISLIEGIEFPTFEVRNDSPMIAGFIERVRKINQGKQPSDFMDHLYSYESLMFVEQCIRQARLTNSIDITKGCSGIREFEGITGRIKIDNSRNAQVPMRMARYTSSRLVNVE